MHLYGEQCNYIRAKRVSDSAWSDTSGATGFATIELYFQQMNIKDIEILSQNLFGMCTLSWNTTSALEMFISVIMRRICQLPWILATYFASLLSFTLWRLHTTRSVFYQKYAPMYL
jgi:hypothetical protein